LFVIGEVLGVPPEPGTMEGCSWARAGAARGAAVAIDVHAAG